MERRRWISVAAQSAGGELNTASPEMPLSSESHGSRSQTIGKELFKMGAKKTTALGALLLVAGGVISLFVFRTRPSRSQAPDLLSQQVLVVDALEAQDGIDAVRRLAEVIPVPVNIEMLGATGWGCSLPVRNFRIPAGSFTVKQLLAKAEATIPGLRWSHTEDAINVLIDVGGRDPNPLDTQALSSEIIVVSSASELVRWLAAHYPEANMVYTEITTAPVPEKRIQLHISKGMTVRDMLNHFGKAIGCRWETVIHDRPKQAPPRKSDVSSDESVEVLRLPRVSLRFVPIGRT